jgi:hypothetical protein
MNISDKACWQHYLIVLQTFDQILFSLICFQNNSFLLRNELIIDKIRTHQVMFTLTANSRAFTVLFAVYCTDSINHFECFIPQISRL